jgi:ATP/maltotriose-dependent transcriptional regulator MalT/DNA-binding SARP family transcriptional activator
VGLLHRGRLVDFIHDHVNRKLLLISAAPGYGKTSLLIDFLQDTELPACWYAMDPSDSDPWRFMTYLVASITETFPEFKQSPYLSTLETRANELDLQSTLQSVVNAIQETISEYFVILIDDFQFAAVNETIVELVSWFLDHQPDNCCLVLASRVMPDLPYLTLTAKQEIAGLGSEDLAFTPEEIQAYLAQNHNLHIPLEEAARLAVETEGWITGILLGTHTLWKGLIRSIAAAKARDQQVFDYLAQEIYDQQADEIKRFLKATSILDVMTPRFCDDLLGISNSAQLLDYLEQANLFLLRLSGEERTFRYHALFQDFLRKQFEPDGQAEKAALEVEAGELLLAAGDWEAALEHFLEAGAEAEAIGVLKGQMEETYREGRLVTLARWLDAIDAGSLAADPALLIMRGRLYRQGGDFDRALELYHQAGRLYAGRGEAEGVRRVQIHEALVHHYSGALEQARDMAQAALSGIGEDGFDAGMQAQAHRIIGEFHHLAGELERAKAEFRRSLELYEQAGDLYHQSVLLQGLGTTARRMGNPLEAQEHYKRALAILQILGNRWRIAEVMNNIGVGHYYQGEYEQARAIFLQALEEAREVGHLHTEAVVLASLGDLFADLGSVGEAQAHFQDGLDAARQTKDAFLEVYCLCSLANLYRVDEAWEHAEGLLDQASRLSGAERSGYLQGLVALARGMVAHDQGRLEAARAALEAAIGQLSRAGGQRELTRAHLWHAHTAFRLGDPGRAREELSTALNLAREIKHPHLLVVDGSRMTAFLEQARGEGDNEGLDGLLGRIRKFKPSPAREAESAGSPAAAGPGVEVTSFGGGVVKVDGSAIAHTEWKGPLVKELFFYLFEHEPVRREVILEAFWPEYSPAKAQSVFHASLYRMRRLLPKGLIRYDSAEGVYRIEHEIAHRYDAREFQDLIGRASGDGDRAPLLEQAVGLYRGEFLPAVYSDWCAARREAYQRMYVQALSELAELEMRGGRFDRAADCYQRAVEVEPFQEALHRGLMRALSGAGRHKEALRHYQRLEALLEAEMSLPPGEETRALYEQIQGRVKAVK